MSSWITNCETLLEWNTEENVVFIDRYKQYAYWEWWWSNFVALIEFHTVNYCRTKMSCHFTTVVKTTFYNICIWSQMLEMQCTERITLGLTCHVNWGTWLQGSAAKQLHEVVCGMFVGRLLENYLCTSAPSPPPFNTASSTFYFLLDPENWCKISDFSPKSLVLRECSRESKWHVDFLSFRLRFACLNDDCLKPWKAYMLYFHHIFKWMIPKGSARHQSTCVGKSWTSELRHLRQQLPRYYGPKSKTG